MPKDPKNKKKAGSKADDQKMERILKRQQQYRKLFGNLMNADDEDLFKEEKAALSSSFQMLVLLIEDLGPYAEDGKLKNLGDKKGKTLSEKDLNDLQRYYKNAIEKLHEFTDAMWDTIEDNEKRANELHNVDLYQSMQQEIKTLKSDIAYYDVIAKTLSKDLNAINNITGKKLETNLHDVYEESRINSEYTAVVTDAGKNNKGNQNERIAVTLTDKSGNKKVGYFTPDNKLPQGNFIKAAVNDAKKKYGKAADFLNFESVMGAYEIFRKRPDRGHIQIMRDKEKLSIMGYENACKNLVKWGGNAIKPYINTPEKLQIFLDVAEAGFKARNQYNIHSGMEMNPNAKLNRRNAAMSKMAELLGCPDVLAESENVKIIINGKPVKGTFMKTAIGEDCNRLKETDLMLKSNQGSINELSLKKQVADLQILDFICGNPDRHAGNMLYHFIQREDGQIVMDRIQGIDNDTCMGTTRLETLGMSEVSLDDMRVITKDMANRILKLDKESLKEMFYGFELSSAEMRNMLHRVDQLKQKIVKDMGRYNDTYKKGYVIPGTIKIVDDDELKEMSIKEDLALPEKIVPGRRSRLNAFNNVTLNSDGASAIKNYSSQLNKKYIRAMYDFKSGAIEELTELLKDLDKDTSWGRSSQGYDDMFDNLKELKKAMTAASSEQEIIGLEDKIKKSLDLIDVYIQYKIGKNESWMRNNEPHDASRTERRFNHAVDAKNLLSTHLNKLSEAFSIKNQITEFEMKREGIDFDRRDRANRYISSNEKREITQKRDENLYNNHLSRSLYRIKWSYDCLAKEKQKNPPSKAQTIDLLKIQYDTYLGFGLNSIEENDRPDFIKKINEHTGQEMNMSEKDIIMRGMASYMVLMKYNLQVKQKNYENDGTKPPLNENEKKVLGYLDNVDISNLGNATDKLLNTPEFKEFYSRDYLNITDNLDEHAGDITFLNTKDCAEVFKDYQNVVYEMHPEKKPKEKIKEIPLKKVNPKNKKGKSFNAL